jgi:hypothetical protein
MDYMTEYKIIYKYFRFLSKNKKVYFHFNKQLLTGELAGFFIGVLVAVIVSSFISADEFLVSSFSSVADYAASILGFLVIFYFDNKSLYIELNTNKRVKKILRLALGLWPSIALADIAFIIARPYFHYLLLTNGIDAGIAATIAHFLAFGIFNIVAILSRSIFDFVKVKKVS